MKYNRFFGSLLFLLFILLLNGCTKIEVDKEVYVDSYINSIYNRAGIPVYSVMHTAYSFVKLDGVSVKGTNTSVIQLSDYSGLGFSYYTPVGDSTGYKTTIPSPETFSYEASYNSGEKAVRVNATVAKSLLPPKELKAEKTTSEVVLSWKAVENTEAYKVRIFSQDANTLVKNLIYESDYLIPKDATSDLSLPFSLVNLSQYLSTNLIFDVSAFIFEENQETFHAVSCATVVKYFGV